MYHVYVSLTNLLSAIFPFMYAAVGYAHPHTTSHMQKNLVFIKFVSELNREKQERNYIALGLYNDCMFA